jgi:hypothetical protein
MSKLAHLAERPTEFGTARGALGTSGVRGEKVQQDCKTTPSAFDLLLYPTFELA